ncbi:hypothetical protein DL771_007567 [Monosporascus sp. 5C6A]|nr:hypothetical protein DL771_007567 [Monosporascus sp. 5C6A]
MILSCLEFGDGRFASNVIGDFLRFLQIRILRLVSKLAAVAHNQKCWNIFWSLYFVLSLRRRNFSQNYLEAWRLKYPDYVITVFIDRTNCLQIPCAPPDGDEISDRWLLEHLAFFHRYARIQSGLLQVLLPKTLVRVDVVELVDNTSVGHHILTLKFGYRNYRQIEALKIRSSIVGRAHVDTLRRSVPNVADGGGP